jgi:ribosomal protein S6--L-glutamate ligase
MKKVLLLTKKDPKQTPKVTSNKLIRAELEKRGYEVSSYPWAKVSFFFDPNDSIFEARVNNTPIKEFDLVYFRTVGDFTDQATVVSNYCELNNLEYFDKKFLDTNVNSKLIQSMFLAKKGLSTPKTLHFAGDGKHVTEIVEKLGLPVIAKGVSSSRGEAVFLLKTKSALAKFVAENNLFNFVFQEFIPNDFEWRIVVVDGQIGSSEKKVRKNPKEFRNNVKLGAEEVFCAAPSHVRNLAKKATRALNLTVAGVDIIEKDDRNYIIEINRSPAFTKDLSISNEIPAVVEYIEKCLK